VPGFIFRSEWLRRDLQDSKQSAGGMVADVLSAVSRIPRGKVAT